MLKKFLKDQGFIADTPGAPMQSAQSAIPIPSVITVATNPTQTGAPALPDDAAYKVFMAKINVSTIAGYDDFTTMNADLKADIPDPIVRARTAIKSVSRMRGITPQVILQSVEDRIRLLTQADAELNSSLTEMLNTELSKRDTEILSIQTERERLEKSISELRVREATLQTERKVTETDLRRKQEVLRNTAKVIGEQLTADRNTIATNLN